MAEPRISSNTTTHYAESARDQVQRSADRFLKVVLIRDLLPQLRKRAERMYQLMSLFDHFIRLAFVVLNQCHMLGQSKRFKQLDRVFIEVREYDLGSGILS